MKEKSTRHQDAIGKVADALDNIIIGLIADDIDLDRILAACGEARGYIIQAEMQAHTADVIESVMIDIPNDQPRVYADELRPGVTPDPHGEWAASVKAAKKGLPKLKPQGHDKVRYKPGITKMLRKAIEFDCPTCHAEAGTFCFLFTGPGTHTTITDQRNNGKHFHTKRTDLSTAANDRIRKQNIAN